VTIRASLYLGRLRSFWLAPLFAVTFGCASPTIAAKPTTPPPPPVFTGIDNLVQQKFKPLAGRHVGLITNHTGLDRLGRRTIDVLHEAPNFKLVSLFSPEHGLAGVIEGGEKVGGAVDRTTRLPVHSLYGKTRRPTAKSLENIDTLVFDIQDVGTRFYTYITTMGYAMEAAAKQGKRFIVLDRPNPITGLLVDGPLTDPDKLHFIAYRSIPVVHGMTTGELARLFNDHFKIGCQLEVIAMRGWKRSMWWDQTKLPWVNPSPNIRNPTEALLYPAVGLLEMTNLSVGRGTDAPFERFGAPWINGRQLAERLNAAALPGLRFTAETFQPTASKHRGVSCGGVRITVTDRNRYAPVRSGLTMARTVQDLYGAKFERDRVNTMIRNDLTDRAWQKGSIQRVGAAWATPLANFRKIRHGFLIYD
jgi:uncharacterized protein YbbC (DUF1343 family)